MGDPSVSVMLAFARSGGTLLNRLLLGLPGTIVLSEVHPNGGVRRETPASQARDLFGLAVEDSTFAREVVEIEQLVRRTGGSLVVRDWSYANYLPVPEHNGDPPGRLEVLEVLRGFVDVRPFALVRNAVDTWLSAAAKGADLETFARGLRSFVEDVTTNSIPVVRYEDVTADPEAALRELCDLRGVPAPTEPVRLAGTEQVRGDIHASRGLRRSQVTSLPRQPYDGEMASRMRSNRDLRATNQMLGYPTQIEDPTSFQRLRTWHARALDRQQGLVRRTTRRLNSLRGRRRPR